VRLKEYEPGKSDGYVRGLDRESTLFFFINFPEETLVGDLLKLFAKHGRVGEVFIPQKLNTWGCRFGFVKFREVKNVGELERMLADIWLGSFKLRVDLSLFAKGSTSVPAKQPVVRTSQGRKEVQPDVSYKNVLVNNLSIEKQGDVLKQKLVEEGRKELVRDIDPHFFSSSEGEFCWKVDKWRGG
jgi:hypothetical protein